MAGFTPIRAELPLDGLEAFRLASFNIEYVPQYAPIVMDQDCQANRWFSLPDAADGKYAVNLHAFKRCYGLGHDAR